VNYVIAYDGIHDTLCRDIDLHFEQFVEKKWNTIVFPTISMSSFVLRVLNVICVSIRSENGVQVKSWPVSISSIQLIPGLGSLPHNFFYDIYCFDSLHNSLCLSTPRNRSEIQSWSRPKFIFRVNRTISLQNCLWTFVFMDATGIYSLNSRSSGLEQSDIHWYSFKI
jgi:hypothetical protein